MKRRRKQRPVMPAMCGTCPFRDGSPHAGLAPMLAAKSLEHSRICHSTGGSSVFYGRTGKPLAICRGSRDIQLKLMHKAGVIAAPTDAAWTAALTQGTL